MSAPGGSPDKGLRFECTQCGKCCTSRGEYSYVYLNRDEIRTLADFFGMTQTAFRREHTFRDEEGLTQLAFEGEHCKFLDPETNACTVYEARPTQCRTFPFWRGMVEDGRFTQEARDLCEGVGQGRLYSIEEIEARVVKMEESEED